MNKRSKIPLLAAALTALALAPLQAADQVGLEPLPRIHPLVPAASDAEEADLQDQLVRQLTNLIHSADLRIGTLQAQGGARLIDEQNLPELVEPRLQRDQAWKGFQQAMKEFIARVRAATNDPLAVTDPVAKEQRRPAIAYANQLSIAECYKDLIVNGRGTLEDLAAGVHTLDIIDGTQLAETEKPRLSYLKIWFLAEQARNSTGEPRAKFLGLARQAQREFIQQFPMSGLAQTAQVLLLDFDEAPETTAPAPQ